MSSQNSQRGRPAISDDGTIIDAVTDTFWKTGFAETTISDLSTASGASRASLYKLYGDKNALVAAALGRYAARFEARVTETLRDTTDPGDAVEITLRASASRLSDPDKPNGCLRCRATLELKGQTASLDAAIKRANQAFEANMLRLLSADGAIRSTDVPMSRLLTSVVNGMVVMAEAGATQESLMDVVSHVVDKVRSTLSSQGD